MVDNRSTGFYGMPSFSFKSGDASGMANAMTDDKQGQGGEYFAFEENHEEENKFKQNEFVDRSAQLRGSLDSLAMLNSLNITRIKKEDKKEDKEKEKQKKKNKKTLDHLVDDYEKN